MCKHCIRRDDANVIAPAPPRKWCAFWLLYLSKLIRFEYVPFTCLLFSGGSIVSLSHRVFRAPRKGSRKLRPRFLINGWSLSFCLPQLLVCPKQHALLQKHLPLEVSLVIDKSLVEVDRAGGKEGKMERCKMDCQKKDKHGKAKRNLPLR